MKFLLASKYPELFSYSNLEVTKIIQKEFAIADFMSGMGGFPHFPALLSNLMSLIVQWLIFSALLIKLKR